MSTSKPIAHVYSRLRTYESPLFLLLFGLMVQLSSTTAWAEPPNILFILTDDQACASLSCYGGSHVDTPNLDGLAEQGIRFTDAYVMPQCTPTRAALLTGEHTARNGMWHVIPWYGTPLAPVAEPAFREELLPHQCRLPRSLRDAGYVTGMAGKWHLTTNPRQGYYTYLKSDAADEFGFDYVAPPGQGSQNEGDKWVNHLTDYTIDFMREQQDRPWFFYLSHHTLHGRVIAPLELIEKYSRQGAPETGLNNATYLAAIEHLDTSIGRLMKALEETGQVDNTLVVFLADNGGVDTQYHHQHSDGAPLVGDVPLVVKDQQLENDPLREGKGSMYEGGIRVPCIARWPARIEAGQTCSTPIHVVDWLPTLLHAAGKPTTDREDGVSLVPVFAGKPIPDRSLYWYMPLYDLRWAATPCAVIRDGDWKLIEYFGDWYDRDKQYHIGHRVELYNLDRDLAEANNLADVESQRATRMQKQLHQWIESVGAVVPGSNPHHDSARRLFETKTKPDYFQPYAP